MFVALEQGQPLSLIMHLEMKHVRSISYWTCKLRFKYNNACKSQISPHMWGVTLLYIFCYFNKNEQRHTVLRWTKSAPLMKIKGQPTKHSHVVLKRPFIIVAMYWCVHARMQSENSSRLSINIVFWFLQGSIFF